MKWIKCPFRSRAKTCDAEKLCYDVDGDGSDDDSTISNTNYTQTHTTTKKSVQNSG